MTQNKTARLIPGQTAPVFIRTDNSGTVVDLTELRGGKVLLSFYRNAACALCNLRVRETIQRYESYKKAGLAVIAVFESGNASLNAYVGKQQAPFPIVGDPEGELYDLYGLETSQEKVTRLMNHEDVQNRVRIAASAGFPLTPEPGSNFYRLHGDFLIEAGGVIRTAFYADVLGRHLDFEVIDRFAGL